MARRRCGDVRQRDGATAVSRRGLHVQENSSREQTNLSGTETKESPSWCVTPSPRPGDSTWSLENGVWRANTFSFCSFAPPPPLLCMVLSPDTSTTKDGCSSHEHEYTTRLDVVLFPWLAFGHMIPYLELAKRLEARGHAVTFLSMPRNVARLPPMPVDLSPRLRFVALPPPTVEGMPEGAESTADVPPEKNELIKKEADGLAAPFAAFLAEAVAGGRRPDWLVIDFCHYWLPPIAEQHNVPCAAFLIVQANAIAFMGPRWAQAAHPRDWPEDFTAPPKWCPSWRPAIAYRRHDVGMELWMGMQSGSVKKENKKLQETGRNRFMPA